MNNLLIPNPQGVEKLIKKISEQGKRKIHVLADFDRTLTKAFYQGQKAGSLISHLRKDKGRYLTPDYAEKAQELFNKYHPIEIGSAPIEEKKIVVTEVKKPLSPSERLRLRRQQLEVRNRIMVEKKMEQIRWQQEIALAKKLEESMNQTIQAIDIK